MLSTGSPKKIEANSRVKNLINQGSHKELLASEGVMLETREEQLNQGKVSSKKLDFKKIPQMVNKPKDSYMLNQAKSFLNKMNLRKEITLKKLEELSADNLKPFQDQSFNPEDLFEKNTGDDDIYLAEYSLNPKEKILKSSPRNDDTKPTPPNNNINNNGLMNEKVQIVKAPAMFRKSKSPSPPRQNVFEGKSKENLHEPMRSPLPEVKKPDFKSKLLERAKKIDIESKEKENQVSMNY